MVVFCFGGVAFSQEPADSHAEKGNELPEKE
jgi:hypothetical protein